MAKLARREKLLGGNGEYSVDSRGTRVPPPFSGIQFNSWAFESGSREERALKFLRKKKREISLWDQMKTSS